MPMTAPAPLVCVDDEVASHFAPFALTRPWSEVRVGALLVRERWELVSGHRARHLVAAPALRTFRELGAPSPTTGTLRAGTLLAHARCAVALRALPPGDVYRCEGRVAAVRLVTDVSVADVRETLRSLDAVARAQHRGARAVRVDGVWCDAPWDAIRHLGPMLAADIPALAARLGCTPLASTDHDRGIAVRGPHAVWCEGDVVIEPHVVFDTSAGPVLLRRGAEVHAFTRMQGPCVIGTDTMVLGGRISGSSIGDQCRVQGDLSASIVLGHANKAHEGFIGHSMLGRWVNLGAGTTTSNLKNTYGAVSMWTPQGVQDTGLTFLGTLFGDHVKTGIGLRLSTGTVVGAGSNLFNAMPPTSVAPFSWGSAAPYATFELGKFLEVARRAMERRGVTLDAAQLRYLRTVHGQRGQ